MAAAVAGRTLRSSGDLIGAEALQNEAAATFHDAGFPWGESDTVGELALIARDRGDARQAFSRFAETLRLRHAIGANIGIASGLVGIAELARRAGSLDEAARLFGAASAHVDRYGYTPLSRSRALHGISLDEVSEAIAVERFAQGWDAGRMLSTDQAVTEAIALSGFCGGGVERS